MARAPPWRFCASKTLLKIASGRETNKTLVAMSFLDGSDSSDGEVEEVAFASKKSLHGIGSSSKAEDNDTLQVNEQFAKRWDVAIRRIHLPRRVQEPDTRSPLF